MSTPQVKAPTKKAFHFPKSAADKATATAKADGKASKAAAPKASATPKTKAKAPAQAAPAKTAVKATAAKPTRKTPETKQPAKPSAAETAVETSVKGPTKQDVKVKRVKKEKVVRDSFTMPKSEYAKIATLKQKCQDNGVRVKKSELLRAALAMLDAAPDKRLVAAIKALETVKTGRPANV